MCVCLKRRQEACAWMGRAVFAYTCVCSCGRHVDEPTAEVQHLPRGEREGRVGLEGGEQAGQGGVQGGSGQGREEVGHGRRVLDWRHARQVQPGEERQHVGRQPRGGSALRRRQPQRHDAEGRVRGDGTAAAAGAHEPRAVQQVGLPDKGGRDKESRKREKIRRRREAEVVGRCAEGRQNGPSIGRKAGRPLYLPTYLPSYLPTYLSCTSLCSVASVSGCRRSMPSSTTSLPSLAPLSSGLSCLGGGGRWEEGGRDQCWPRQGQQRLVCRETD